jgi:hypothetical protein
MKPNVQHPQWASAGYLQAVFGLSYYRLKQIEAEIEVTRPAGGYRLYNVASVRRYLEGKAKRS